jgi:hypothetical protein
MSFGIFFKRPSDHVFNPFSLHKSPVWKRLVAHSGEQQVDDDELRGLSVTLFSNLSNGLSVPISNGRPIVGDATL